MQIRKANSSDCQSIAELHKRNLDQSFLGTLGVNFLRLLYQALVLYPGGFLIIAAESDEIVGFVSGVDNVKKFYKFFIGKKWPQAIFTLLPNLFSINNLKKIFETSRYGKHQDDIIAPDAELLSIALDEKYRGRGISAQLFERLAREFTTGGIHQFKIIVGASLLPARKFYQKMGCVNVAKTEIHHGQESEVLIFKN